MREAPDVHGMRIGPHWAAKLKDINRRLSLAVSVMNNKGIMPKVSHLQYIAHDLEYMVRTYTELKERLDV